MQGGRELLAAVFLRDDHAEEALVLDELPGLGRQVLVYLGALPIERQRAQLLGFVVEERLFLGRERRLGEGEEPFPVRRAGKKIRVPPHRAGVDRLALRLRHRRQDAPIQREHAVADQAPAQAAAIERARDDDESRGKRDFGRHGKVEPQRKPGQKKRRAGGPQPRRRAEVGKDQECGERCDEKTDHD